MIRWIKEKPWQIDELRLKIIRTFFLLLIYRLATYIPLPGISFKEISNNIIHLNTKGVIQIISAFTGVNFSRASLLSLGIMPYISSSIFLQFLSFAFPNLQKEVTLGSRKLKYITILLTIMLCILQSPVYLIAITSQFLPFFYMPKAYILDISCYITKAFFF